jgi:hypothetical protein
MEILVGVLALGALACVLTLAAAAFDDKTARYISAILLARAEAREAYRGRYAEVLAERESEFGLRESQEAES